MLKTKRKAGKLNLMAQLPAASVNYSKDTSNMMKILKSSIQLYNEKSDLLVYEALKSLFINFLIKKY